jgi:hypothetical protein
VITAIRSSLEGAVDPKLMIKLKEKYPECKTACFVSRIPGTMITLYVFVLHDGKDESLISALIPHMRHLADAGIDHTQFLDRLQRIY